MTGPVARLVTGAASVLVIMAVGVYAARHMPSADDAVVSDTSENFARLMPQPADVAADWLTRSPFVVDHSAFARPVAPPPPPPEAPPANVQLLGVSRSGSDPRAAVMLDGEERVLALGAETRAGTVIEIGLDFVVFDQAGERRRVGLFD